MTITSLQRENRIRNPDRIDAGDLLDICVRNGINDITGNGCVRSPPDRQRSGPDDGRDRCRRATMARCTLNLSADELLTTTRSVRKRLDFDRPVEREVVEECLEIALQAPTGGNRQGWHWVFVEDPDKKKAIADIYAANFAEYAASPFPAWDDGDTRRDRQDAVEDSATYLAENFHRAPLLLDSVHRGPDRQRAGDVVGIGVGVAVPGGVELHARPPRAWHGLVVDDDPPDERRRTRRWPTCSGSPTTR